MAKAPARTAATIAAANVEADTRTTSPSIINSPGRVIAGHAAATNGRPHTVNVAIHSSALNKRPQPTPLSSLMPDTQLAVQLYTLRDHCKTEDDFAKTCGRLREMGWGAVQVSAVGVEDPKVVRQILDDHGLVCCATHCRPPERIWQDPQGVADELETLGTKHTAVGGYFPKGDEFNESNWSSYVRQFNEGAAKLKALGYHAGYHNHSHEWAKLGGKDDYQSRTAMDLLVEQFSPDVWFEIDVYWVAHAGGNPAAWLKKLRGRLPVIHVKDLAVTSDKEPYMAEVGVGNLDWDSVLGAAKDAGVDWYCVEQDTCYRDPFDSLETSLKFLQGRGLS